MNLDRYFKRNGPSTEIESSSSSVGDQNIAKRTHLEVNLDDLPADPGLRKRIEDYDCNIRDQVRRAYVQKGPCQPRGHSFPQKMVGQSLRRFQPAWFDSFGSWLEYSMSQDAAYCLCCYLFKNEVGDQSGGEVFVSKGFSNWKKTNAFKDHVGPVNSTHQRAMSKYQNILNTKQHIQTVFSKQSNEAKDNYRTRLNASIDVVRLLLKQGLAFRGHDESEDSLRRGNFLEVLKFLTNQNEKVKSVALKNAPGNLNLVAPSIQKDIVSAVATLTTKVIISDIGDAFFSVLIDESRDV